MNNKKLKNYDNTLCVSFLDESVDDIPAVLAEVWEHKRDMHPAAAGIEILFPYQLVKREILADVFKPLAAFLDVAIDAEVCRLTFHVLGVIHTAHGLVELLTAETAANLDGFLHSHPKRLQNVGAEIDQVDHLLHRWFIVYSETLCRVRGIHLFNRKVHSYGGVHIYTSFSGSISWVPVSMC